MQAVGPPVARFVRVEGDCEGGRQLEGRGQTAEDLHIRVQVQQGIELRQLPQA